MILGQHSVIKHTNTSSSICVTIHISEVKWKSLNHVRLFATPWTIQSMEFSRPEWVAFPFSRGSSQPRNWTQVSRFAGGLFTSWAAREALSTPSEINKNDRNWQRLCSKCLVLSFMLRRWAGDEREERRKAVLL